MMGIGTGSGESRAEEASRLAISSPLLEASIEGARGVLLSIAGPSDLALHEVNRAAETITKVAHPDANIIFGAVIDDVLGDQVRVTVIAAGFDRVSGNGKEAGLSRVLESQPAREPVPSLLQEEEEEEMFRPAPSAVVFDAEEDLDIPDFLKS